jgi:nicotinamidase-related amidase
MPKSALVVVDMINTKEHEDADMLVPSVREVLPAVRRLIARARQRKADVIYVNDDFGRWRSHLDEILDAALSGRHPDLVEPIVRHWTPTSGTST